METSKLLITLKKSLLGLIIIFSVQLEVRGNHEDSLKISIKKDGWVPTTSLYFELGGKLVPSINIDFRKNEDFAICISTGFWTDSLDEGQLIFTPSVNAYYFFGKRKRIEIGGGTGPFLGTYSGFASLLVFANIGYRYQKKKGLFFRACFTPFIAVPINDKSTFWISPWAGISIGYSF
jgi:hypothetical protein